LLSADYIEGVKEFFMASLEIPDEDFFCKIGKSRNSNGCPDYQREPYNEANNIKHTPLQLRNAHQAEEGCENCFHKGFKKKSTQSEE